MKIPKDPKPCYVCEDGHLHYDVRDVRITHRGLQTLVTDIAGGYCDSCGEIDFDPSTDSARRYAAAGDKLVLENREIAKRNAQSLKAARRKLKLTQAEAATFAGGGHNAFSRYETGSAQPVAAVVHLFELLARHPELLPEMRELAKRGGRGLVA